MIACPWKPDLKRSPPIPSDPPPSSSICSDAEKQELDRRKQVFLADLPRGEDFWVFGYGSLLWKPGFAHVERHPALLEGWRRSFCIHSVHYRGTPDRPGLVLGLERGGECHGIAFRVAAPEVRVAAAYLWDREMISGVYCPAILPARLDFPDGEKTVSCHTFIAEPDHHQFAGGLPREEVVRRLCTAKGATGSNRDYLLNTTRHLDDLGVEDPILHDLARTVAGVF